MVKSFYSLTKKNQSPAPTPVKAVEQSCVTCGGAHSYQTCPATSGNVYRDNIQEYVSQAAAANFNQGNTGYRAQISNQIRPPGFPPVVQPPAYQAPAYQAPAPQNQGVSKEDFHSYLKAMMLCGWRNMQYSRSKHDKINWPSHRTCFPSLSLPIPPLLPRTLPSNTVTNPKEDLKDFVVVDFEPDPRVPLILGRSFLKTSRALIDVYEGEITLRVGREAITFNQTKIRRLLSRVDPTYSLTLKGTYVSLEAILNSEPLPPLQGNYFPKTQKDLKICEANHENSSINKPPELELKDLPPYLEYAFLEGDDKLPVIIAKDLKNEEKAALIEVLKSHKRAIAWKLSDIKGINPEFCTHKILMDGGLTKPTVQHQSDVRIQNIYDVIKKRS
ncbi:hypothetical protein Tco_0363704 [Tanacetum coccineum]